jgi:hypothetical protein
MKKRGRSLGVELYWGFIIERKKRPIAHSPTERERISQKNIKSYKSIIVRIIHELRHLSLNRSKIIEFYIKILHFVMSFVDRPFSRSRSLSSPPSSLAFSVCACLLEN